MLSRTLLAALAAATPLAAQFDFDLEKRTAARLGDPLELEAVGAPPSAVLLLVPSTNAGPTPLSLLVPGDLRVLAVGTDLLGSLTFAVSNGAGAATWSFPLPNDPSVNGFELFWQSIELSFSGALFGGLSNDVVTLTGLPDRGVLAPAALANARAFAAALIDADNNASQADVLVTGGGAGTLTSAVGLATTERWDFRRMRRLAGPTMGSARALHAAVPLTDGRVLVIGGADATGTVLASCEIYDPATNSFSPTGNMTTPRILFGAARLADGRVMVAGGTATLTPDVTAAITATLRSAEIWNPANGQWSATANLGGNRLAPALTRLPNGQIMVSGGVQVTLTTLPFPPFPTIPTAAVSTNAVQRWNPANGAWTNGPNMAQGRAGHQYNQVTLADGRVLMTGGVDVPSLLGAATAAPIAGAEVFAPAVGPSGTWTTVNMPTARALHTATRLADGRVVVCGGAQGTLTTPVAIADVDVFDPVGNSWSSALPLTGPRSGHVAEALPDGTLILFGGQGATTTLTSIETLRF